MPQFELEGAGPARFVGLARGRDPQDAVRRAACVPDERTIDVGPPVGSDEWQAVRIDGVPAGRIRPHQRMRFRRD